jgi:pyruvate kinase
MSNKEVMRHTKIVATLGPASSELAVLKKMIASGLNIVRENFSHGTAEQHRVSIETVRKAATEMGQIVGIMADLQGPKIRVSKFKQGKVALQEGAEFTLDAAWPSDAGDVTTVGIDYKELPDDVAPNDILLLDDGRIVLIVKQIENTRIVCRVTVGGILSNNKGINRQGGGLTAPALTDKDKEDLKVAVSLNVDYIAISFPRSADDIEEAKSLIKMANGHAGVIAKIERLEAMVPETLDEIIKASDGIMVARGDLAVEIGEAQVPGAQKLMIRRARALNKPVITATQMMETMIQNVVPTRAEVSDVANAVLDNTDAVMLSAETATGIHPDLVIKTMARICFAAEQYKLPVVVEEKPDSLFERVDEAISVVSMYAANHMNVKAIISLTESGATPLWMSRICSEIPIFGLSRHPNTLGRMALYRDVHPIYFDVTRIIDGPLEKAAVNELQKLGFVKNGDLVIITRGPKQGVSGGTNTLSIISV